MDHIRLATVWLGGCSGCHMSFLDLDEFLIDLAMKVEVVYSPIADIKTFPENVDVTLVEGAVANDEHLHQLALIRRNSRIVIAFGDCAVTGNVPSMRNPLGSALPVLNRSYKEIADINPQIPSNDGIVPTLLDQVRPIHDIIKVDMFLPGCPPSAARIRAAVEQLLAGQATGLSGSDLRFG
ncbi:MAG: oxidoreductase [Phycisphaerales bacterium]|nr:oxidoreductase [Phycisphaerales bacterium]